MKDPQSVAENLEEVFTRILNEQMRGIPILNPAIRVQALGFQVYQGRVLGVLITPWLMNVVMLPRNDEDWSAFELGKKQAHKFPSGTLKFMINEIDGIGICQTHSLYSPMREFTNQVQAVRVAQAFLDSLMVEKDPSEENQVNEELLGKLMRGEVIPETDFPDFSSLRQNQAPDQADPLPEESNRQQLKISRRNLLKGKLQRSA